MPTTLTVTPGHQFANNEAVTLAHLNQLGSPTVTTTTLSASDFETTETLFAAGACTVSKRITFLSPAADGNTLAVELADGGYAGQEKFIVRLYNAAHTNVFNLTVAAYGSGVEAAAASRVFRFPSDETAGGLFLKWDGAAWRAMDRMDAAETITTDAQTASLILPVTVLDSGSGSKTLTLPAGWRVGQPKRIVVKTAGCTWTVNGTFANSVTSTTLVSTAVNALDLTWDGAAWQGAVGTGVPSAAATGGEHSVLTAGGLYDLVPAGVIMPFGGETVPTGWLECDGSSLERAGTYNRLYLAIGTKHGAADGTHFNLPDLRGQFLRGWDHGRAKDPDAASRTAAATGGATGDHVGTEQADQNKAHTHTTDVIGDTSAGGINAERLKFESDDSNPLRSHTSSSSGGTEARPNNIALLYCIKT